MKERKLRYIVREEIKRLNEAGMPAGEVEDALRQTGYEVRRPDRTTVHVSDGTHVYQIANTPYGNEVKYENGPGVTERGARKLAMDIDKAIGIDRFISGMGIKRQPDWASSF